MASAWYEEQPEEQFTLLRSEGPYHRACSMCGALVAPATTDLHLEWHAKHDADVRVVKTHGITFADINEESSAVTPNQPKTPVSNFRIPTALKERAAEKAAAEGRTLTSVIVEQLEQYVAE